MSRNTARITALATTLHTTIASEYSLAFLSRNFAGSVLEPRSLISLSRSAKPATISITSNSRHRCRRKSGVGSDDADRAKYATSIATSRYFYSLNFWTPYRRISDDSAAATIKSSSVCASTNGWTIDRFCRAFAIVYRRIGVYSRSSRKISSIYRTKNSTPSNTSGVASTTNTTAMTMASADAIRT